MDKIAIACQGGGSQTAFTAGVLSSFFNKELLREHQIVGLSGTSGGAICAALAWYGLLQWAKANNPGDVAKYTKHLLSFWEDNGTENILERYLNFWLITYLRLSDCGILPEWNSSPYALWRQLSAITMQAMLPGFYDLKGLLKKTFKSKEANSLFNEYGTPVLLIGAANIMTGKFEKFNSRDKGGIDVQALLASAAVPTLFKAVCKNNCYYYDGLYSDNPPIDELVYHEYVGKDNIPNQLWVIQINPQRCSEVPQTCDQISDRRNEMQGNASLVQDLQHICRINRWVRREEAFNEQYKDTHNLREIEIYCIQMSDQKQKDLDYPSKMDRNRTFIQDLIAHGKEVGDRFINDNEYRESMRFDCGIYS